MNFVSGKILTIDGFKKGHIGFNKKNITEVGRGRPTKKPIAKGLIVPTFVNAHTHIGDSFIKDRNVSLPKNIEKLVGPDGLKSKLLNKASDRDLIEGMEKSIDNMLKSGTNLFCDFREGGILGITYLKTAINFWPISSFILSRPHGLNYDKNEVDLLLRNSDGIGLSSISDWDYSEVVKIAKDTKRKKKIFALHASERIREDIDLILDLKPDFLVHMIKANESDLIRVKENGVSIVICPRSNAFYNLKPDISLMKKTDIDLLLGTDNAMLNSPSILDEINYFIKNFDEYNLPEILYMVTYNARKVLNDNCGILGSNSRAEFVVLDEKSLKPLYLSV